LLFLVAGSAPPPSGFVLIGTTEIVMTPTPRAKRAAKITIAVYQMQ